MIYVDRGEEPEDLAKERSRRLASAAINGRPKDCTGYDPDAVRTQLHRRQHSCCVYCGGVFELEGQPIEHFRPKAYAEDVNWAAIPDEPDDVGSFFKWFDEHLSMERKNRATLAWVKNAEVYWWLAWTWENLAFACVTCNSPTHKGNRFPLKRGTPILSLHEQPPAIEQPLLLDLSRCDPLEHLLFAPDMSTGWGPVAKTIEGRWTIAVLGLHQRPTLRTQWTHRAHDIENNEAFKSFFVALGKATNEDLRDIWDKLTRVLLYQGPDYRAFRWCVFEHHFRRHKLERLGLQLRRPWQVVPSTPKPVFIERPELDPFPERLRMRVRALRPKPDNHGQEELKHVLVELCGDRALTSKELAEITERKTPGYLESEYLRPLTSGPSPRLAYDPQTKTYRRV